MDVKPKKKLDKLAKKEKKLKKKEKKLKKKEKKINGGMAFTKKLNTARGDGYREGLEAGRNEGKFHTLFSLVKQNIISKNTAAKHAGITAEEFERIMNETK